ncbi:MAG: hypothetical protein IKV88_04340 [Clostridia bacterium]|nr:hypothetical protein [Clostridia bacterium]
MEKNSLKYLIIQMINTCIGLITTGTVLQTFMLELGYGEQTTAYFESFMMIIQSISMLALSGYVERKTNILNSYAVSCGFSHILIVPLLALCLLTKHTGVAFFVVMCIFGVVGRICQGIYNITFYKLPYQIMDMKNYGTVTAYGSVGSGILAALFSALIMALNKKFGLFGGMKIILVLGILLSVVMIVLVLKITVINTFERTDSSDKGVDILRYKPFRVFAIPDLCRGIFNGVINVVVIVGYHNKAINSESAVAIVVLTQIASGLGALIYAGVCKKIIDGKIILLFAVLTCASLSFMVTSNMYVFLITYFIAKTASSVNDNAIPVAIAKIVDYSHIGRYSAFRILIHMLGTAIGGGVIIYTIDCFGKVFAMIITGMCIMICAIAYFMYFKKQYNK